MRRGMKKKAKIMIVVGALAIAVSIGCLLSYKNSMKLTDVSITDNMEGKIEELSIVSVGTIKAEKEEFFGYSREALEMHPFWWQVFSEKHYQYLEKRFGLEETDFRFDFENHYYLISYGKPVEKLYSDTTKMYSDTVRGKVPGARTEWSEETPYTSQLVYIYETDKVALVDIEWN